MPLKAPNLDDRTFEDIISESKRLIPRYAPEWTDWNESDPGISIIQLFAWLSEMIIYRLNKVPDKNFIEFLRLVGVDLKPATPARADLTFTISPSSGQVLVPKGTEVGLEDDESEEPIVFETDEPLVAVESKLIEIQTFDGTAYDLSTDANTVVGKPYHAFGEKALQDSALYLGFDLAFPQNEVKLTIYAYYKEDLIATGSHCTVDEDAVYPPAKVVWEYYNGSNWSPLDVTKDSTLALTKSGSVYFKGPANQMAAKWGKSMAKDYYWIRCRVTEPGYELPPQIDSILLNTVSASSASTIDGEILGSSDGSPNQVFTLLNNPIIDKTLVLQVDEGDGWKTWKEVTTLVASSRNDEHYQLNRLTGEVKFGDGEKGRIPLPEAGGNNIMALKYRYGGGKRANVGKGKINSLESSVPSVEAVINYRPAYGGKDEEQVEDAKKRGPMELKVRQRAVTAEDFEFLAVETPGVRVRRANALPLFHPDFPECKIPGSVTVIIVPESLDNKPLPSEGMIRTVCKHLNTHRLLTNEVHVIPPSYVKIEVKAKVVAKGDADASAVKSRIIKNLTQFFHPLKGGADGEGWGFGDDIYFSDVYKRILDTEGVERIESVLITMDGKEQEEHKNIVISGNNLLYSENHQIDVNYKRT